MTDITQETGVQSILLDMEEPLRMVQNAIAGLGAIRGHSGNPRDMVECGVFALHEVADVQFRNVMKKWRAALEAAPKGGC